MTADDAQPVLPESQPPRVHPRLNRRLRIAMWLAAIGGPLMIVMEGYEYYRAAQLKTAGVVVPGKLFDSDVLDTGKGRSSYRITLDYRPENEETIYRKVFVVDEALYHDARQKGTAPVTFLPGDPTFSTAGDDPPVKTEPLVIGGGLILVACAVWFYLRRQAQQVERYVTGEAEL